MVTMLVPRRRKRSSFQSGSSEFEPLPNNELSEFIKSIRQELCDAAKKTDQIMLSRGFDPDGEFYYLWVEAFADTTNQLIRERNEQEFQKHLVFFSKQLDRGNDLIKKCIDVSYVENLMWNLENKDKKWAWPQIPKNLKRLYLVMWGKPTF